MLHYSRHKWTTHMLFYSTSTPQMIPHNKFNFFHIMQQKQKLENHADENIIVGGDFNGPLSILDTFGGKKGLSSKNLPSRRLAKEK